MATNEGIVLIGAAGRMGRLVSEYASEERFSVVAAVDVAEGYLTLDRIDSIDAAVCIDFSLPEALPETVQFVKKHHLPLVCGTTGLRESEMKLLHDVSAFVPVLYSANMSLGIAVLRRLVRMAAQQLSGWDIELTERHHRHKKDAPSGTALALLNEITAIRENMRLIHGREGVFEERKSTDIGVHSVRAGEIAGDHQLLFAGPGEHIELSHHAASRLIFARGALRVARWIIGKVPGFYSLDDTLA